MRRLENVERLGTLILNAAASFLLFVVISLLLLVPGDPSHRFSYMRERGGYEIVSVGFCAALLWLTGWWRKQRTGRSLEQETSIAFLYAIGGVIMVFVIAILVQQFQN